MTERKGTPDILGAILSGAASPDQPTPTTPAASPTPPPALPASAAPVRLERAPRSNASRQTKWEYLVVSFHEQNGWHARFVNGHELENWQRGPQLHDVLDQLGEDGWELINVVKSEALYGTMDRIQAFFKRAQ
jgi:hypothetical protein